MSIELLLSFSSSMAAVPNQQILVSGCQCANRCDGQWLAGQDSFMHRLLTGTDLLGKLPLGIVCGLVSLEVNAGRSARAIAGAILRARALMSLQQVFRPL